LSGDRSLLVRSCGSRRISGLPAGIQSAIDQLKQPHRLFVARYHARDLACRHQCPFVIREQDTLCPAEHTHLNGSSGATPTVINRPLRNGILPGSPRPCFRSWIPTPSGRSNLRMRRSLPLRRAFRSIGSPACETSSDSRAMKKAIPRRLRQLGCEVAIALGR